MATNTKSPTRDDIAEQQIDTFDTPASIASRGREITGLAIFRQTLDIITPERVAELMGQMHASVPSGGQEFSYGPSPTHILRYWKPSSTSRTSKPPLIVFIHGGSWRVGTYLDSLGAAKVEYLVGKGYAFATVNYTLVPAVSVQEQVQEVASAISHLITHADAEDLDFDAHRIVLMGHSSGAHVAALLGTDTSYLSRADVSISRIHGVITLDGSNFNAAAEILDSPGPVAENMLAGLGNDPKHLRDMSPVYHARAPNARAWLLLQVQRQGDVRQAVEFAAALEASGTEAEMRVFEGEWFEGHMAMLLRVGEDDYPATGVLGEWLEKYVPVA